MNIVLKVKRTSSEAKIPRYAHSSDAGFDLTATSAQMDEYGNIVYGLGLAFEIPPGYYMQIQPRSSSTKKNLILINTPSIIDSGFRGEVTIKFRPLKDGGNDFYKVGDRIAQGIILPYPTVVFKEVEDLSESDRGVGGYGSTGN